MEDVTKAEILAFIKEMIMDGVIHIEPNVWESMYSNERFRETYKQLKQALEVARSDASEVEMAAQELEKQNNEYKEQLQQMQEGIFDRNDVRSLNTLAIHQKEVESFDFEIKKIKDLAKIISLDKYDCYRVMHVKAIAECIQDTSKKLDKNPKDSKSIEDNMMDLYVILFKSFASTTKACRQFVESNKNLKKFGESELNILRSNISKFAKKIDEDKKMVQYSNQVAVLPRVA